MKRFITSVIAISFAIIFLVASVSVHAENNILIGDANGDGEVTAEDAATILRYIVGLVELNDDCLSNADANLDSRVTSADAALILRYIVGLDSFPNPTPKPTETSTFEPTLEPTNTPIITSVPTVIPTLEPTQNPTECPTANPTTVPTQTPAHTLNPTVSPTATPTIDPTKAPTQTPTISPTPSPTPLQTETPTPIITATPTPEPQYEYIWVVDEPAHWELKCNYCGFQTDDFNLMKEEQIEHTRNNEPCGYHLVWVIERGHWEIITS